MCRCNTTAFPIRILDSSSAKPDRRPMAIDEPACASPAYSLFGEDNNSVTIQEDETCFLLSIEMPNMNNSDVQISLRENVLSISGFRRSRFYSESFEDDRRAPMNRASTKRQRISRQLVIDPNAIDIERAMTSTWNGCYTLYAPKRVR
uniref:SHSP domain-containing protein n=1 Tax=Pseudo-nitzschia delicatissima TaxID=44447 RepID=A0A7S0UK31_9STRA|mmetsp:Transcript_4236/g.8806  ORF Transcript_4236/g.8806 Transcript_4236/m.8806 type:complete len:148 (+) Transcript_4236:180-623(+)